MLTRKSLSAMYPSLFPDCGYNYVEHPSGWDELVLSLVNSLSLIRNIEIRQIKEKFGGLVVYYSITNDFGGVREIVDSYIGYYYRKSTQTCQECGAPGDMRGGTNIATLCDEHAEGAGATTRG